MIPTLCVSLFLIDVCRVDDLFKFFTWKIVSGNGIGFNAAHYTCRIFLNPATADAKREESYETLVLLFLRECSIRPPVAEIGEIGCGEFIQVDQRFGLRPIEKLPTA